MELQQAARPRETLRALAEPVAADAVAAPDDVGARALWGRVALRAVEAKVPGAAFAAQSVALELHLAVAHSGGVVARASALDAGAQRVEAQRVAEGHQ